MYKLKITALEIAFLICLSGCREPEPPGLRITSLKLTLSKSRILGDSIDYAKVSVVNQDGTSVMEDITIYFHGEEIIGDKIKSATPTVSTVYAMYNDIKSNEEEIEVVEDKNLKFEKNVLLEQYTGTWCGWCPRAINQISTLEKTDRRIVHAAHHLNDEMTYNLNMSLFQSFGFTGIPTVHADRLIVWNGDVNAMNPLHSPSRVGISMEVTGDTSKISVTVNIKFGYDFSDNLDLSVYLMHDSLVANQANYYNTDPNSPYYQRGAPMVNFVHRNVMIKSGTDMFGELIPPASIDIGTIYTRKIDFTNFECKDIKKMVVITFVTYMSGTQSDQVLNCSKARVGEKLGFAYTNTR